MNGLSVSVIVVSRGRPNSLGRCIRAISQLYYHPFELVVVADAAGIVAVENFDFARRIKTETFNHSNISAARNRGLALAGGDIVAFIDDDAVPEPGWLFHLAGSFQQSDVDAACGYVLSRNGISFQSTASTVNEVGKSTRLDLPGNRPVVYAGRQGRAIKTEGTNCAFRRDMFETLGGFDPNFHYFMDETDLNIRVAHARRKTAVVPLAQVHHGVAESERRHPNRLPKTLFEVGASTAVFLRKHASDVDHEPHLRNAFADHRKSLLRHVLRGSCEPRDVARLLHTFQMGIQNGRLRILAPPPKIFRPKIDFRPLKNEIRTARHRVISGYRISRKHLRKKALSAASRDEPVSLFVFSRTSLYHKIRYHPDGYWEQSGGLFGRSLRQGRLFQLTTLAQRTVVEDHRLALVRHPETISCISG